MADFGNTTTPGSGYFFDDTGNCNFASNVGGMPAGGGMVTDMYVYIAGDGTVPAAWYMIWDGSGNVLFQSGATTIPSGTQSIGGQAWRHTTIPTPFYVAGGTTLQIGIWTSGHVVWTYESSGTTMFQRSVGSGGSNFSSGGTEGSGALGAYITYTPGGVGRINTGSPGSPVWTTGVAYVNTGTAGSPVWTPNSGIFVNTGTAGSPVWTPTS